MLDATSKRFLDYLDSQPKKRYLYSDDLKAINGIADESDLLALIHYLEPIGYLEYILDSDGDDIGVQLSHPARHRKEFGLIAFKEYLRDKWIAILALFISIPAFIMAILSLSH